MPLVIATLISSPPSALHSTARAPLRSLLGKEEEEENEESVALLTRSGSTIQREKLEMLITKVIRDVELAKANWRKKKAELDNYIEKVAVLDEVHTSTGTLVKLTKYRVKALAQLA
jgi:hypothetical protein